MIDNGKAAMTKRILIIDDDDMIREVAQMSLEAVGGYEVRCACSGAEGLALASVWQPDAILLDVMMPEMDGPTTLAGLRADPRTAGLPVVFLTAKQQTHDRRSLAGLGAAGVLAKPFDPLMLADDLGAILGWKAS